ncbi:MAG: 6-bladed beta-propeller [Acidobacteria bacterium RIFCSPLOWO2_02_FULL_65_29]|nr:MAG: 6-bladed beta-propeller [Acidobacteria bacterium RIFCSPLOWO2_02_FULL_65_29]
MNRTLFSTTAKPVTRALACAVAALIAACAPLPPAKPTVDTGPLVFPAPPDEPRFVFERTIYSSADVALQDKQAVLRSLLTGQGTTGEGLNKPNTIAVYQGRIFLSDSGEAVIRVFDVPNGRHFRIGEDDPGKLSKPLGIDVDRSGNLYVADSGAKSILIYNKDGKFLRRIGNAKWFDRLANVTVDPKGDRIYLVDIGGVGSQQHRVRVVDAASGEHLFDFGKRGKDPGEFNFPRDLAVGKDGRLYVVDSGNFRIQVFDRGGKFLKTFGAIGRQVGQFARPKEIAADPAGNLYVVDTAYGNFQIFSPEGELLLFIGSRSERDGPARYMLPSGIYADEDGRVYMVDQWFRKIDIFRPYNLKADGGFLGQRSDAKAASK